MASGNPTIRDVAARAGVSKSLVSLALQDSPRVAEATRATIRRAADELGYRPNANARSLGASRSRTIGVFVLDLHNPIYADMLDGVQTETRRSDYRTIVVLGGSDRRSERAELEKLMEFRVEGLIALGHRLPLGAHDAISEVCPAVLVGAEPRSQAHVTSVSTDDLGGAAIAVDHLVDLGHERITHITGGSSGVARKRERGYVSAMASRQLRRHVRCVDGGFTDEDGYRGTMEALRSRSRPTALFVANDFAAMGALAAASDSGLSVPHDLSIVGFDGARLTGLRCIDLTTVAQPLQQMGALAASRLCAMLDGDDEEATSRRIHVTPQLVVRGSTARLGSRGGPPRVAG